MYVMELLKESQQMKSKGCLSSEKVEIACRGGRRSQVGEGCCTRFPHTPGCNGTAQGVTAIKSNGCLSSEKVEIGGRGGR